MEEFVKLLVKKWFNYLIIIIITILIIGLVKRLDLVVGFTEAITSNINSLEMEIVIKRFINLSIIISSITFVWNTSYLKVPEQKKYEVTWSGSQTDIFLKEGDWFLPLFKIIKIGFGIFWEGILDKKNFRISIEPFVLQDKNTQRMVAESSMFFRIQDEEENKEGANNFQMYNAEEVKKNISDLAKRIIIKISGTKDYHTEILGHDITDEVKNDRNFVERCSFFGIICENSNVITMSGNPEQDELNNYANVLRAMYKRNNPGLDDSVIEERVQVQLKLIKKVSLSGDAANQGRAYTTFD